MVGTQEGFVEVALGLASGLESVIADARAMAIESAEQQRKATAATQDALGLARQAAHVLEAEKVRVTSEMVAKVAPQLVEGVRHALVIKEQRFNRNMEWTRAALIGSRHLRPGDRRLHLAHRSGLAAPLAGVVREHCVAAMSRYLDGQDSRGPPALRHERLSAEMILAVRTDPSAASALSSRGGGIAPETSAGRSAGISVLRCLVTCRSGALSSAGHGSSAGTACLGGPSASDDTGRSAAGCTAGRREWAWATSPSRRERHPFWAAPGADRVAGAVELAAEVPPAAMRSTR